MSKLFKTTIFMLFFIFAASAAYSLEKFGIGLGVNAAGNYSDDFTFVLPVGYMNLCVPIQLNNQIRIEPEIGLYASSYTTELEDSDNKYERSASMFRIGAGVLFTIHETKNTFFYVGPRLGFISLSTERDDGYNEKETEDQSLFMFGGALGGEYFLGKSFSLGIEFQLNYCIYGEPDNSQSDVEYSEYSHSIISTNGIVFARIYF